MFAFSSPLFWYKLVFAAELMVAEAFSTYTLNKRSYFAARLAASIAAVFIITFFFPVIFGDPLFNSIYVSCLFLAVFALTLAALKFCYDEKFITLLFCGIIAYTTQHISFATYNFFIDVTGIGSYNVYGASVEERTDAFSALAYVVIYFLIYWFIWAFVEHKIRQQEKLKIDKMLLFCFAGLILVDIVLSIIVTYMTDGEGNEVTNAVMFLYRLMSCSFALGMLYSVLGKRLAENELEAVESLWRQDRKNYELSKENIELINIKCHDLKHQIRKLRTGENIDGKYLKELEDAVGIYDNSVKTGSEALDLILTENSIYMTKHSIRVRTTITA